MGGFGQKTGEHGGVGGGEAQDQKLKCPVSSACKTLAAFFSKTFFRKRHIV